MKPEIIMQDSVALITLQSIPNDAAFISSVFNEISKMGIDVDMISISPAQTVKTALSFTVADEDLVNILGYISKLKDQIIKPIVSSGNCKINVSDKSMEGKPGVAAAIFSALADAGIDIRLITTSESQVSILTTQAHADTAMEALSASFE